MNKIILATLAAVLAFGFCDTAKAGVTFLPASGTGVGNTGNNNLSSDQRCRNEGYNYTACESNYILAEQCPYNYNYYKNCCPEEYQYTKEECLNAGLNYSRNNCAGYYKCL